MLTIHFVKFSVFPDSNLNKAINIGSILECTIFRQNFVSEVHGRCLCESESGNKSASSSFTSYSLGPNELYSPWNSPGKNTAVVAFPFSRGSSQPQGSNPGLLHCRQILYQLSHKGSPRILERVSYPFFSGSS